MWGVSTIYELEEKLEQLDSVIVKEHERVRGKRKPLPDNLPREVIVIEIPLSERICTEDGSILTEIGEVVSERLEIIPQQIKVIKTIRKKYGCSVCEGCVKTAPCPLHILPKCNAGTGLIAHVMVSKYLDHLPLYRLENIFERMDINLTRGTLGRWIVQVGEQLTPIMNLLEDELMASSYLQCDETRVQVLNEKQKLIESNKYMWIRRRPGLNPIIIYEYDPSRASHVPKRLLADFKGYLQVDGYGGYNELHCCPV